MTAGGPAKLRFSVIVASWDRADWLRRCLMSLRQLDYPAFEIVVVADARSLDDVDTSGLKTVQVDEPNLSRARNRGVGVAAGDVCVFIDDDSVAEPLWLAHFANAFQETSADAVVGYVRGRNGISFQSRVSSVDAEAETHVIDDAGDAPFVPALPSGQALKLVGTNFAILRHRLLSLGGFDENMRFFLEDTDLSLRLLQSAGVAAVAPLAQVHHGFASSSRRTGYRVPLDLCDIGRSTRVFLLRHFYGDPTEIYDRMLRRERARLLTHMVQGNLEPRDVPRILASVQVGWADGHHASRTTLYVERQDTVFQALEVPCSGHQIAAALFLSRRKKVQTFAKEQVARGARVTVFSFSLTNARHYVRYVEDGFWLQTGGLFGRTRRLDRRFKWCKFAHRVRHEIARIAKLRGLDNNQPVNWWGAEPSGEDKVK